MHYTAGSVRHYANTRNILHDVLAELQRDTILDTDPNQVFNRVHESCLPRSTSAACVYGVANEPGR